MTSNEKCYKNILSVVVQEVSGCAIKIIIIIINEN
jgi:hypothetical protein